MALWHGFRQYAVDLAVKVRSRLGLSSFDRLDIWQLAGLYDLPIVSLDQLTSAPEAVQYYTQVNETRLSGFLVRVAGGPVILVNPAHSGERIASTITHEVSHCILCHESKLRLTGEDSCLSGDPDQEDEANWLGGELLLPREAARRLVFRRIGEEQAADMYGVSVEMARWRMNVCGAGQMQRRARVARRAG